MRRCRKVHRFKVSFFAHSFMNQTANAVLSNGTATLEERLGTMAAYCPPRCRAPTLSLRNGGASDAFYP
jgi:hypothetical protein